jgi:hypothetical protein
VTRYRFTCQAKGQFGARRCCRVLGVSCSSHDDWRRGPAPPPALAPIRPCWGRSARSTPKVVAPTAPRESMPSRRSPAG